MANYVDDNFGPALLSDCRWYEPYQKLLPSPQVQLLLLWDELQVPHSETKQIARVICPIIGFEVDVSSFTVTLPCEGKQRLLDAIEVFCDTSGDRCHSLRDFQALTGYANWAFNVFPLLRPSLSSCYAKMAGKTAKRAGIYVNAGVIRELQWLARHLRAADGVRILSSLAWTPADLVEGLQSDEFALVDASGRGLGMYFPWLHMGFYCDCPSDAPTAAIFWFEALAVCSAVHRVHIWKKANRRVSRLAVLSDNMNTVAAFNTLRASPIYNSILVSSIDILIADKMELRVDHVPGRYNSIADALSRGNLDLASQLDPALRVFPFKPPQDAMGAMKK